MEPVRYRLFEPRLFETGTIRLVFVGICGRCSMPQISPMPLCGWTSGCLARSRDGVDPEQQQEEEEDEKEEGEEEEGGVGIELSYNYPSVYKRPSWEPLAHCLAS